MRTQKYICAGLLASMAGLAFAQPTIDGVYDAGTEGALYSDVIWFQTVPTGFGDNQTGDQLGGAIGNPADVTTGTEISIPLSALGNPTSFRIAGWINSGDRGFISNQILHDGTLPADTNNIGGTPDWDTDVRFPGSEFVTVASFASGTPVVDGTLDAAYGASHFTQTNFTGFGDNGDATDQGGGGSEIDGLFIAADATNLYIFIAGNIEANGNGLDLYIDTDNGATGASALGAGTGSGDFIINGQSGMVFDTGFAPNYVLSVDSEFVDPDRFPRAYFGSFTGNDAAVDLLGTAAGYGSAGAGALTGGDVGVPAVSLAVDNSNIEGVGGSPTVFTPAAPDSDWAYGSELDNVRVFIDAPNSKLYLFIAGNMEINFNKLNLFFDVQPGGQNVLRDDNVDISFNNLNGMSNITFDAAFEPDYWMNINRGVDGGTGEVLFFTDAATLRTNGVLLDAFFGDILDYGSFSGGPLATNPVIDFSGPRVDIIPGGSLFAEYAPRLLQLDPFNPVPALIQVALDNSNVDGVTDTTADSAAASAVSTGIELCIDLDELGWDGSQDILVAGWVSNNSFDFVSNQVLGGIPGPDNVGPRDSTGDGINDLDFNTIAGDQFINLSNPAMPGCAAELTGDVPPNLNLQD
ncbi:MAG: hypothetical protein JKY96_06140, partial [Phycisphaerales bacterium]|nr:hypothetical protein [Phycisphaerales bacterium]